MVLNKYTSMFVNRTLCLFMRAIQLGALVKISMFVNITLCLNMRACQLGALVKPSSRLELHIIISY